MELERGDQNKLSYFMEQVVPFGLPFLLCRVGSSHQSAEGFEPHLALPESAGDEWRLERGSSERLCWGGGLGFLSSV